MEEEMKKTIITLFAFLILFGFAVSGAMAQTWSEPQKITNANPFDDFMAFPDFDVLRGLVDETANPLVWEDVTTATEVVPSVLAETPHVAFNNTDEFVIAPPAGIKYGVYGTTVGMWVAGSGQSGEYAPLDLQPNLPEDTTTPDVGDALAGSFTHIAAGSDGTLYVIFEDDATGEQYLLVGDSNWEEVTVRFSPRSLNLGSQGRWVTCKISGFPKNEDEYQYTPADVDMDRVCIVAINGVFLAETDKLICSKDSGGPFNNRNKRKLMIKFDRQKLAAEILAQYNAAASPDDFDLKNIKITVAGYGGQDDALQFFGEDTIKAKVPKKLKKQ
jgi:hypothetical protein